MWVATRHRVAEKFSWVAAKIAKTQKKFFYILLHRLVTRNSAKVCICTLLYSMYIDIYLLLSRFVLTSPGLPFPCTHIYCCPHASVACACLPVISSFNIVSSSVHAPQTHVCQKKLMFYFFLILFDNSYNY